MTNTDYIKFFSIPHNLQELRRLSQDLRTRIASGDDNLKKDILENLSSAILLIVSNPEKFDELTTTNIKWIGDLFLRMVNDYLSQPRDKDMQLLQSLFTMAYRFICELEFSQPGDASMEMNRIMRYAQNNLDDFSPNERQQIIYASYTMPAQIVKRLINHPSIGDFRKFTEAFEASRELKKDWDSEIKIKEERIDALEKNLSKISAGYNFVGLIHGFKELRYKKEKERLFSLSWLTIIALAMIIAPVFQIGFVINNLDRIDSHKLTLAYTLPTILAIELILLYFFRVVLSHFRSIKAQLLQIELRVTLCQFIESYTDYSSSVKSKDASALSKFEALVFSGLVTDETGIPSTFDGAEQIASLIKSFRSGN